VQGNEKLMMMINKKKDNVLIDNVYSTFLRILFSVFVP